MEIYILLLRLVYKMTFQKGYTAKRWQKAREFQSFHELKTGEKLGLKEFYKNDNVVTQNFFTYEVTFGLEYEGKNYQFFIPQESFTIQGYGMNNSESEIIDRVKEGVSNNFNGKSAVWVGNNTNVEIRGVEKVSTKYGKVDFNQLTTNNVYADNIPHFEVGKGRTKNSANKNKYSLNIWL